MTIEYKNNFFFIMKMNSETLEKVVALAWSKNTSSDSQSWTPQNPAWGQCAVTALIVNDYLGGEILWAEAKTPDGKTYSHYFNSVNDTTIDFTRRQFPPGTEIPAGTAKTKGYDTTRGYILSF